MSIQSVPGTPRQGPKTDSLKRRSQAEQAKASEDTGTKTAETGKGSPETAERYREFGEALGLMWAYGDRVTSAMKHLEKSGRWQEVR